VEEEESSRVAEGRDDEIAPPGRTGSFDEDEEEVAAVVVEAEERDPDGPEGIAGDEGVGLGSTTGVDRLEIGPPCPGLFGRPFGPVGTEARGAVVEALREGPVGREEEAEGAEAEVEVEV